MSWMRPGHKFEFFKTGRTTLYVYGNGICITDSGAVNSCNDKELIELIGKFINSEENGYNPKNMTYAIVRELAQRMKLNGDLKPYGEVFDKNGHFKRDDKYDKP